MSKSVELLADSGDEPISKSYNESPEKSRLNLNGSRHLSKSAIELRDNEGSPKSTRDVTANQSRVIHHHQHHRHTSSVAQRTQTFFASLKNRWTRSKSRERKKHKKTGNAASQEQKDRGVESDYAADYSSEQSRSSSANQSPAKHCLNYSESSLGRSDSPEKCISKKSVDDNTTEESHDSGIANPKSTDPDVDLLQNETIRKRELALRQHAFFQLRLIIKRGSNLIAMDRSGASDPYIKVKCGGRLLHKSKTVSRDLNPVWDESVTLPIEDPFQPLTLKVFDYDWGLQDDFMGSAILDLTQLDLGHSHDLKFELKDPARLKQNLGEIFIIATLFPRNQQEKEQYFQRNNRLADVNRRLKSQIWSSVVTIVLVEAKDLQPMNTEGSADSYVKFRLGTEKYKSKVIHKTLNPVWREQFDLHLYEDPYWGQELEVSIWDRDKGHQDELMGKTVINLTNLERETTHRICQDLEEGTGSIFLLLTISGTTASETISDLAVHEETAQERIHLKQRYSITNTFQRLRDVGHLTVKVYRAQGLAVADLGGKSDPFCVLELINSRLQTQTEYKTLAPNWQKIFTFNVKDVNSVLEVTVYDEDRDHKVEFLGKLAIPLLSIRNGEKRWYALKDKKLRSRAKGNFPQILLELTVVWNALRACVRTLNPKEKKYMEPEMKFKRQIFIRNVFRLKAIVMFFIDIGKYIQSCWEWESKVRSIIALFIFVFGCYFFEPYMIPTAALLILLKYYLVAAVTGESPMSQVRSQMGESTEIGSEDYSMTAGDEEDDDDDKDKVSEVTQTVQILFGSATGRFKRGLPDLTMSSLMFFLFFNYIFNPHGMSRYYSANTRIYEEKMSLKEKLQAVQEVTQSVQNSFGYIASLCEKVKNLFTFTVPYLSYLALILILLGTAVLYFIPVRYLILLWGINKFSRKLLRPHSIPNNEVLDLISRVPDDEEILDYRELKPSPMDCESGPSTDPKTAAATKREQRKRQKVA